MSALSTRAPSSAALSLHRPLAFHSFHHLHAPRWTEARCAWIAPAWLFATSTRAVAGVSALLGCGSARFHGESRPLDSAIQEPAWTFASATKHNTRAP